MNNIDLTTPIVTHFTDDDLYKFTMQWAVLNKFPRAQVKYKFIDRKNTVYPADFAYYLRMQIDYLKNLHITNEEIEFMKSKLYFMPEAYFTFLRGFRFNTDNIHIEQYADGTLDMWYEGNWWEYILFEVKILCIVSELYHKMSGHFEHFDYEEYYDLTYQKGLKMFEAGVNLSEFGTRRRMSFDVQETAINALVDASYVNKNCFRGTSNVYFAMKHNLTPIGTMAHEWISAIAAFYGPSKANYIAMEKWEEVYDGALGIYLYDTYGFDAFAKDFTEKMANAFRGLRVDSGSNIMQCNKIIGLYNKFNIDPTTKQVMFSNALDTDRAIELHNEVKGKVLDGYGIGTHITCDTTGYDFKPLEIVIKLIGGKITEKEPYMNNTCKMSNDVGKVTGNEDCVNAFKYMLNMNR